jgi:hypothetical protein
MARSLPKSSTSPSSSSNDTTTNNNNNNINKPNAPMFGVDSNTQGGGVWAQTSSKREKLAELLTELKETGVDTGVKGMDTLTDAAVGDERLDLDLVHGLGLLVQRVDGGFDGFSSSSSVDDDDGMVFENDVINRSIEQSAKDATKKLFQLLQKSVSSSSSSSSSSEDGGEKGEWNKYKFEATMNEAIRILNEGCLPKKLSDKPIAGSLDVSHPFCYLRQFVSDDDGGADWSEKRDDNDSSNNNDSGMDSKMQQQIETLNDITSHAFTSSTILYRTLLLRSVAQTLLENWDKLTTITSGDIDRAAVSKVTLPSSSQRSTVNAQSIHDIFMAYATKSSRDWVQSWWKVIDADSDGLIDQEEMNSCVELTIQPVHLALRDVFDMALEVCPVRTVGLGGEEARKRRAWFLMTGDDNVDVTSSESSIITAQQQPKLSWRNRRKELKARKILTKTFQSTLDRHFRDQVELPHRLRCIYAWAEKSHQDNKLDSILVDASEEWGAGAASAVMGRKRYVELEPKISYSEFRELQQRHFAHLDKIGEEFVTSFKEDIWLLQGKKRQNKELKRDCFLFLLGVSLIDMGIGLA